MRIWTGGPISATVGKDKDREMEMDLTCHVERWQYHQQNGTDLGFRRQKKTGQVTSNLEVECKKRESEGRWDGSHRGQQWHL